MIVGFVEKEKESIYVYKHETSFIFHVREKVSLEYSFEIRRRREDGNVRAK